MDKETSSNLADKIIGIFDDYGLLPRDMNKNDQVNLRNAKYVLSELLKDTLK